MKKFGLALGGGASRGFVHIGVLKLISESKIKITEVSGTSMGGIIASLYALGYDTDKISEIIKSINFKKLVDIGGTHGLIKGKKVLKKMYEVFGDTRIEDTAIPLRIVATNIETGKAKVFKKGKIAEALRASISLPGIFMPYKIGNYYYLDGGVVNNLPIEALSEKNVIGVSALKIIKSPLELEDKFFRISFLKQNYDILHRAILLMMKQNEDASINSIKNKSIIIKPKFGDLDYYHYDKIDDFITLGYNEAKKKLKKYL